MNVIVQHIQELRQAGKIISRISTPFPMDGQHFACSLATPVGFTEYFLFEAPDPDNATTLWAEAIDWLYPNLLYTPVQPQAVAPHPTP